MHADFRFSDSNSFTTYHNGLENAVVPSYSMSSWLEIQTVETLVHRNKNERHRISTEFSLSTWPNSKSHGGRCSEHPNGRRALRHRFSVPSHFPPEMTLTGRKQISANLQHDKKDEDKERRQQYQRKGLLFHSPFLSRNRSVSLFTYDISYATICFIPRKEANNRPTNHVFRWKYLKCSRG